MAFFAFFSTLLGRAHAQRRSFRDVAELRDFVLTRLRKQPGVDSVVPDPDNSAQFEVIMGDWSSTGDVTNLFYYLQGNPDEDADTIIGRFINSIAEVKSGVVTDDIIVPVIRTADYVKQMLDNGAKIFHEPLGADLVILYMADRPDSMAPFVAEDVPGKDLAAVRELALTNLRQWLPKVVPDDSLRNGALYFVEDNPMLSPSLLLLDEFWATNAARFRGDMLIALPRKDQLFIFEDDDSPGARAAIRRLIDATLDEGFNLLSPLLYARRDGKITVVST